MIIHYIRLITRSLMFIALLIIWLGNLFQHKAGLMDRLEEQPLILIIWLIFAGEMLFRFFPSRIRSPGCQKQFAGSYIKTGETEITQHDNHATVLVALIWIVLNAAFGALHTLGILNDDFMLLLCCAFAVCDMICILFFCPFQTWFFKNRCCTTCRIYNWDYAMMFTPLFFVPNLYSWSLLAFAIGLLIRWEITYFRHPERFSENTNAFLKCVNCTEKLCRHKKQLAPLWAKIDQFTRERLQKLMLPR